jgi:hypothetical protein
MLSGAATAAARDARVGAQRGHQADRVKRRGGARLWVDECDRVPHPRLGPRPKDDQALLLRAAAGARARHERDGVKVAPAPFGAVVLLAAGRYAQLAHDGFGRFAPAAARAA